MIRLSFICQKNSRRITKLSMHAEFNLTPALSLDLKAFFAYLWAHQSLEVNESLLYTLDNLFPLQLIAHVLLQNSLPMTFPIDVEHKWLLHHILVDHTHSCRQIFFVTFQFIFEYVCAIKLMIKVTREGKSFAEVKLQTEKSLTLSLREIFFQEVQSFLSSVKVMQW